MAGLPRPVSVVAFSLAMGLAGLAHADGTTLKSALISAYNSSNQLAVARANLRATDEGVANARASQRAQVSGSATKTFNRDLQTGADSNTSAVSVTASQLFYDGGQSEAGVETARMNVLASRQNLIDTEQSVFLTAITAFMDVRRDRDALKLAQNNVRVLREQLRAARDRFDVGEVTRTDVSQTEARLSEAISNLELTRGNLRISEQAYIAAVGAKPGVLHNPSNMPKLPGSAKAAEKTAVAKHPRVLSAQFSARSAQFELDRAERNKNMTITGSLTGSLQRSSNERTDADGLTARVQANVPIYSGGALDSARRSALAGLQQARAQVQLQAAITRQQVNRAYALWQSSKAAKSAVRSQIRSAEVAFEGVKEEAKLGARTTLDALDAEQELLAARSSLISASRDEVVAAYTVLSEMGLLTADYLKLGIKTYNPDVNYSKVNAKSKLGERRDKLFNKLKNR